MSEDTNDAILHSNLLGWPNTTFFSNIWSNILQLGLQQTAADYCNDCESYNKLDGRVGWTLCSLSQNQIKKESCILAPAGCWHLHVSVFPWQHSQSDYISTIWQFKYPIQLLPGRAEYIDIKWLWWSSGGVKIVTILSFSIILYTFIPFLSKRPPAPLWLVFWRWSSSVTLNCP